MKRRKKKGKQQQGVDMPALMTPDDNRKPNTEIAPEPEDTPEPLPEPTTIVEVGAPRRQPSSVITTSNFNTDWFDKFHWLFVTIVRLFRGLRLIYAPLTVVYLLTSTDFFDGNRLLGYILFVAFTISKGLKLVREHRERKA